MSMHRTKCRNSLCKYEGMMEATPENAMMKKAFLDKKKADEKTKGMPAEPQAMRIRCPKCGMRWRVKSDQLR
jgi:hypothetical protein